MYQSEVAQNQYQQMAVQTASPEKLLLMLYDGVIRFSKGAIQELNNHNYENAHKYLLKVQDAINELIINLNMEFDISKQLLNLYEYFIRRLVEANTSKDPAKVEEVLGFMIELRDTWAQAALITKKATG